MKTQITYPEIMERYGTPLSYLTHPHQPFKVRPVHVIVGIAVAGLAIYGAYSLVEDVKKKAAESFNFKKKDVQKET